ncbi:MAG: hypothetical protein QUS14_13465 [Pyrinomonadaceae bacterium]|nr:hypothetical protein [Pyrinomonadaceae bacterium]
MRVPSTLLLFIIAIPFCAVYGQDKYDKPISKFGKEEAFKIVNDSPWAKPYQSNARSTAREGGQPGMAGGSNPRSIARDFGPPPVIMRLHSGEVYRKAVVRLQQIDVGYDKFSDEKKAEFDASRKIFLECKICTEHYVVTLTKVNYTKDGLVDEGIFQSMTLEDLKGNVTLTNDAGEERELIHFTPPKNAGDSAILYFKRADASGKHLVTPETKEFRLVFKPTFLDGKNRYAQLLPQFYDFRVSKLVIGGKLMF